MSDVEMDEFDVDEEVERIAEETDSDEADVRESLENVLEFNVPEDEALRSVASRYGASGASDYTGEERSYDAPDPQHLDTVEDEDWVSVEVVVLSAWDTKAGAIDQVYHFAQAGDGEYDDSVVKAIAWAKSDLERLEIGESYTVENVGVDSEEVPEEVDDRFDTRTYLSMNSRTQFEDGDAEAPDDLPLPDY